MRAREFYGHFAAAYGTCFLALITLSLVTQEHIEGGAFVVFGFPLLSLVYAGSRARSASSTGASPPVSVPRAAPASPIDRLEKRLDDVRHRAHDALPRDPQ